MRGVHHERFLRSYSHTIHLYSYTKLRNLATMNYVNIRSNLSRLFLEAKVSKDEWLIELFRNERRMYREARVFNQILRTL